MRMWLDDGGEPWKKLEVFQRSRRGCQVVTEVSCSGKHLGSAAASKASIANKAEAWWCPCPARWSGGNRVMITSGLNLRITHTASARIAFRSQKRKVSAEVLEK